MAWVGFCVLALGTGAHGEQSILDSPGSTAAAAGVTTNGDTLMVSDVSSVEITNESLKNKIAVQRIQSQRSSNNLLAVSATLKNTTGRKIAFEAATIYRDRAGHELNTGSWLKFTLMAHEETEYRSSAINVEAVSFVIRVRKPAATASSN
jgi:hypothetical protein